MEVPEISDDELRDLIKKIYGLSVLNVTKFAGYDDLSLFVTVGPVSDNPHINTPSADGYVFKISNPTSSEKPELIEAQNGLMLFLSKNLEDVSAPIPMLSLDGTTINRVNLPWKKADNIQGDTFVIRLLTFTPGTMLAELKDEPSIEVLMQVGTLVGRLNHAMEGFSDDRFPQAHPQVAWAIENVCGLEPLLIAVDNTVQLSTFRDVIAEFTSQLNVLRQSLTQGIIHGDLNEGNLVVDSAMKPAVVKGLIDFSDAHRTYVVFELAMAICYMMIDCQKKGTVPPMEAGAHVLAGYLRKHSLDAAEIAIIKIGIEARCTQSLVIGQYTYKYVQKENTYVLNTQQNGWAVLQMLRGLSREELYASWDKILSETYGGATMLGKTKTLNRH